ncbi:MAG: aldehyde dehydrogenase family protein [Chitinophagales bacterium]
MTIPQNENDSLDRIHQLFEAQKNNLQQLKNRSIRDRKKKLKALKKAILDKQEKIQKALYADFKKPHVETDIVEIYPIISELKHMIAHLSDWSLPQEVDVPLTYLGSTSYIHYEPKGNCLAITPWNYPFMLSINPIISAIAAGNALILKPSEFTPNTTLIIKEVLANVFEENEVAVVMGDHTVSTELLKKKFNHIHFTGSPMVGKIVMRAASEHLASCTLELGGKSPVIVDDTANLSEAAKKITWGKYLNEGQICIAPDYLLVHEKVKDEFVTKMKAQIENNYGKTDKEREEGGNICRMVNAKHFGRVKNLFDDAVANGANIEHGGTFNDADNYIDPTILTNVSPTSEIMQEEIFGPLLPVITYKTLDEAIAFVNTKEKPLALYLFSKKSKNIDKVINETSAGGTCINEVLLHISQPNLPFGGVNNSGIGRSGGKWGFIDFSNERTVLKQHIRFSAAQLLQPPYSKFTKKMIDLTMKFF